MVAQARSRPSTAAARMRGRIRRRLLLAGPLAVAAGVLVGVWIGGQFGLFAGTRPAGLGVHDGRLKPPAATPNSVSSQADLYPDHPQREGARIAPLPAPGGAAALQALAAALRDWPGARIVEQAPGYLRAEFHTRWMGFVDDAEFWFDPAAGVIQVRSASRLGRRDFGVNRARIEALRQRLAAG